MECWNTLCWPEMNRRSGISPTKMGLFGSNWELQFGICLPGEPHASLHTERECEHFHKGKQKWEGRSKHEVIAFHWLSPSSFGALLLSQGMRAPPSGFPTLFGWGFYLLGIFLHYFFFFNILHPCWFSVLNIVACTCQSQTPNPSLHLTLLPW